ncbi:MAG TPA: zinc ribbon domain-containing protein [Bacillota bacterium]|nr:zinc ribbon domain-containing protein [Bacillota bacterium]HPF41973.1 zinc ribbon domain-containing protein [Bacillota bacterium]HPJ85953.1 zinc ribbon domain-containing protein [Bacillota bacterium]HPQ61847.1 zinc ribbon domain-containing protein [Bacillota bacterium]
MYCKNCGAEIKEETGVCQNCGMAMLPEPVMESKATRKSSIRLSKLFSMLLGIAMVSGLVCLWLSVALGVVYYVGNHYENNYYFYPDYVLAVSALAIYISTTILSAGNLVLSCLEQKGNKNPESIMLAVFILVASSLMSVAAYVMNYFSR